jgi:hypothetical protein
MLGPDLWVTVIVDFAPALVWIVTLAFASRFTWLVRLTFLTDSPARAACARAHVSRQRRPGRAWPPPLQARLAALSFRAESRSGV